MRNKIVRFSLEQEREIISLYKDGYGSEILGKQYGVSSSRICLILKKYSISKNNNKYLSVLSKKEIYLILKLYQNGATVGQLAKDFGVYPNAIKGILTRRGIKIRQYTKPKFHFNEDFLLINSAESAYFYGFILGDGTFNIKSNTPFIKISINELDLSILKKFCKWLSIPLNKLYYFEKINQYQLDIRSKYLYHIADTWGLVPNKTYNPKIPQLNDLNLLKYFIIGLIDADGYVKFIKNKPYRIELVGNKKIMDWVELQLRNLGFIGHIIRYSPANVVWSRLVVGRKNDVIELAKILNINSCPFLLKRKWHDLQNFILGQ